MRGRDSWNKQELREIWILSNMVYHGLNFSISTYKYKTVNFDKTIEPAIYAIWHGRQFSLLHFPTIENLNLLVSTSNDGEIIARASERLGYKTIRGSHKRGGTRALMEIIKVLKKGESVAYTVDGPKGPASIVKEGVVRIAQMSGRPIVPLNSRCSFPIQANSWDKYQVPFLFSKNVQYFGNPIYVPRDVDEQGVEEYRKLVETKLYELDDKANEALKNFKKL